ncbi:MAG: hypothetical protein KC419_01130 [Anaerolineales bacterium]|nr:hypothetical protein [Anaerolineales bacterium]MCA9927040.1 hypothetical protein [Anaerolineales bacterium]
MNYLSKNWSAVLLSIMIVFGIALAACSQEPETVEVTRVVEVEVPGPEVEVPGPEIEVTRVVEVMVEPETAVSVIPFEMEWAASGHANADAEAFIHWNEDDPAEVPTACAKCHSTPGFMDFVGADGSEFGVVDAAAPIGTTIECQACHNDATLELTSVVFPSGAEVTDLGPEARCMQCHQGRASTVTVNQSIADAGLAEGDDDTTSEDLGFTNIHYFAAAATQYGNLAQGGYEYAGKTYDSRFEHVEGFDTCVDCHSPHTLEVQLDECVACHEGVETAEDLQNVRMAGSLVDYDGDGNLEEGIYFEIEGMREILYGMMQTYASEVTGTPIVYDTHSYPYFFIDSDGDGAVTEGEAVFPNAYNAWSPRLAKAAYNYQASLKDPGRFAHGGKYIIQLLYDSIEDVNVGLASPVDTSMLRRIDHGHFAGSEEAFRHWDGEEDGGIVSASCSKCHSANGLPLLLTEGVSISQPAANGFRCDTCHSDLDTFARYESLEVTFPSGATVSFGEDNLDANLCINCHQGRESTVSVDRVIGDADADTVTEGLSFRNVHYFAAGATLFGTEVKGVYEYAGQTYLGRNEHVAGFDSCIECHNTHALEVEVNECAECHENVESAADLHAIRVSETDFDGDGDAAEGIYGEVDTMRAALYAGIQAYATDNASTDAIAYNAGRYPYFFIDANGDGELGADEGDRYVTWTPRLLRAAYNYQYSLKDPGAYAHNGQYMIQVLYDALNDIGADTAGMTRP